MNKCERVKIDANFFEDLGRNYNENNFFLAISVIIDKESCQII